jgi:hypothetical protein
MNTLVSTTLQFQTDVITAENSNVSPPLRELLSWTGRLLWKPMLELLTDFGETRDNHMGLSVRFSQQQIQHGGRFNFDMRVIPVFHSRRCQ